MEFKHTPVLLNEVLEGLDVEAHPHGVYLDCTVGGAGHSSEILRRLAPDGKLIGVDKDIEAIRASADRLGKVGTNFELVNSDFKELEEYLDSHGVDVLDGVLIDLGVSSYQLDNDERGFSYIGSARLDMRMQREQTLSAYEVVNTYSEQALADIIWRYGEDRLSRRIAKSIVETRAKAPITTTGELAKLVELCYPPRLRWQDGNPAKRTFQAIRIEVNGELDRLYDTVKGFALRLRPGGRICVISFHSLEDREIKRCFSWLEADCVCDKHAPICTCGKRREVKLITRKPITATQKELSENKRASSAKLRIAERL